MSIWESYPDDYRKEEVDFIVHSIKAGNSVSVFGLSGSGKSNLLGYIYHRVPLSADTDQFILVDCNKIVNPTPEAFYRLIAELLGDGAYYHKSLRSAYEESADLEQALTKILNPGGHISLLFDRFEVITSMSSFKVIASNLRALRDTWKYSLTFVTATRKPYDDSTEMAELFIGNQLWLGPLSKKDALWSAHRDEMRFSRNTEAWTLDVLQKLVEISWGYPSMLRACCEAYAAGEKLSMSNMVSNPRIIQRSEEFWKDEPTEIMLEKSGLLNHPLLFSAQQVEMIDLSNFDTSKLTQKEYLLLEFLVNHAGTVCDKDDLIKAVWSEDVIFELGIRDESLAQLIRRLRKKIEPDPSKPRFIRTITGRGYLLVQD